MPVLPEVHLVAVDAQDDRPLGAGELGVEGGWRVHLAVVDLRDDVVLEEAEPGGLAGLLNVDDEDAVLYPLESKTGWERMLV